MMNSPGAARSGANRPSVVGPGDEKLDERTATTPRSTVSPVTLIQLGRDTKEATLITFFPVAGRPIRASERTRSVKRATASAGNSVIHASYVVARPSSSTFHVPAGG